MKNLLTETTIESLGNFAARLYKLGLDEAKVNQLFDLAELAIRYYSGDGVAREKLCLGQELERRWYESIEAGAPDYGVYREDIYISDVMACWRVYSRKYIKSVCSLALGGVKRIADLGCGLGNSTAALKRSFPDAEVVGTNLPGTLQTKFAESLGLEIGFEVVSGLQKVGRVDLVFASEYFEHFHAPIDHLREVVAKLKPRMLVIANSFGTRSVGHFDFYAVDGESFNGKTTSRMFGHELRALGYEPAKTKFWNNRPALWTRV